MLWGGVLSTLILADTPVAVSPRGSSTFNSMVSSPSGSFRIRFHLIR